MTDVLVDTDVFVDHLRGAARFRRGSHRVFYSTLTRAELFAGRGGDEETTGRLLAPFGEIPVDRTIAEVGGRIRRTQGLGLADALIAATALKHGLRLMTRNRRDFERVRGLRLLAPR